MDKKIITIWFLTAIITIIGLVSFSGWVIGSSALKRILPGLEEVSFGSALAFTFVGIVLYATYLKLTNKKKSSIPDGILWISLTFVYFFGFVPVITSLFGFNTGIEGIFSRTSGVVSEGIPCIPSLIGFVIVFLFGAIALANPNKVEDLLKRGGVVNSSISFMAGFGYLINFPAFYYVIPGISSAMAPQTIFVIFCSGVILFLIGVKLQEVAK